MRHLSLWTIIWVRRTVSDLLGGFASAGKPGVKIALVVVLAYFLAAGGRAQDDGEDDGSLCGPMAAENVHECHCAHMVEAVQVQYEDECHKNSKTRKELNACLNSRADTCTVMDYPGGHRYRDKDGEVKDAAGHPDQCLRKCRKELCSCNENACSRKPKVK